MSTIFRKCIPFLIYLLLLSALSSVGVLLWKQGKNAVAEPVLVTEINNGEMVTEQNETVSPFAEKEDELSLSEREKILCNVHPLANAIYTVTVSAEEISSLDVTVFDYENTLLASKNIAMGEKYLTSDWITKGLLLVTANPSAQRTNVYLLTTDFVLCTLFETVYSSSAILLTGETDFFLLCERESGSVLYRYTDGKTIFQSLGEGRAVDAFLSEDNIFLFLTAEESWTKLVIENTTLSVSERTTHVGKLLAVAPFERGFATVEKADTVYIKTTEGTQTKKDLGLSEVQEIFSHENTLYFLLSGGESGFFRLDDLSSPFSLQESSPYLQISNILTEPEFCFLASDGQNLLFVRQKGTNRTETPLSFFAERFFLIYSPIGHYFSVYQSNDKIALSELIE